MSDDPDHTRRWLINASGAAILANALAGGSSYAQVAVAPAAKASQDADEPATDAPISPASDGRSVCEKTNKLCASSLKPGISAGACFGGGAKVGPRAFIGLNATIRDNIEIAAGCVVGAGSVVIAKTEPDSVYVGVPAKKLKETVRDPSLRSG